MQTPWGYSQTSKKLGDGVWQVETASHGGIRLATHRNAQVHPAWRDRAGWYEEDVEWAIVAITFPNLFPAEHVIIAHRSAKEWLPDQYERVLGVQLLPAESHTRRQQIFYRDNADRFITTAAWGHRNDLRGRVPVPEGMVGVVARRGGHGNPGGVEAYFLVPAAEYERRGEFGLLIREEFHGDWLEAQPERAAA